MKISDYDRISSVGKLDLLPVDTVNDGTKSVTVQDVAKSICGGGY